MEHKEEILPPVQHYVDSDPEGTTEWLQALEVLIEVEGIEKAHHLLTALINSATLKGVKIPSKYNTPYVNSIDVSHQPIYPGNADIERKLRSFIRWNAMAMVVKANKYSSELGGHIGSFSSSATLYEVAQNHFFKGPNHPDGADMVFFQGHIAPGIYARAYLEGRLEAEQLDKFRQEVDGGGLSSYPHPWLMPDFWQFPTVSMGLGPIQAIYQARCMKYLEHRGLVEHSTRKVWAFLGDGEMDEPESRGALAVAAREKLDNLIFVVNCNLQRLDGPVRGNGKIIQELESDFKGAGWNVIKVIWGSQWDSLLDSDASGKLVERMMEIVDGEYQALKAFDGAYVREHFFGAYAETRELVKGMTDEEIFKLNRGGHDPVKIYAAYKQAVESQNKPVVVLAKTIKGYGLGPYGEAANTAHNTKKLDVDGLKYFRDRFQLPISNSDLEKNIPYFKPDDDNEVMQYLQERRQKLGGYYPCRMTKSTTLKIPALNIFQSLLVSSDGKELSTTMVFVRFLATLLRNKEIGKFVVPIIPDEARTFGMEGLFRQVGIYDPAGQTYEPVDRQHISWYKQSTTGQVFQEGINEAGAMASWMAAGTTYSNFGVTLIPFYIYYSMFGFQRIGDLAWAAGDIQAKGFLIGGTAGRTTLAGEGLQHQDGHNLLMASQIPNCVPYDPTFAYEMVVILQDGMQQMFVEQKNVFYYVTAMNENYAHPAMPDGAEDGIRKGLYSFSKGSNAGKKIQLIGSGAILREVVKAAELLKKYQVSADIWSATSFTMLVREAQEVVRWNKLHPDQKPKIPYVSELLNATKGACLATTDYVMANAEQIRPYIDKPYHVLGTDGFGRSDTRMQLRKHFEVDAPFIAYSALYQLSKLGKIELATVKQAIKDLKINPNKINPSKA